MVTFRSFLQLTTKTIMEYRAYYRRNLPHYQPKGETYFVTFRLVGSIPAEVVKKLTIERKNLEEIFLRDRILSKGYITLINRIFFQKYEAFLDPAEHGPRWLIQDDIAEIIRTTLHYWDRKRIDMIAYCIMPNHVHAVIKVYPVDENGKEFYLTKFMHSIKGYSARQANIILGRTGNPFWHEETYDRVVRNQQELIRTIQYIRNDPRKIKPFPQEYIPTRIFTHPDYLNLVCNSDIPPPF